MSAVLSHHTPSVAEAWRRPVLVLGLIWLGLLLVYRDTAVGMVGIWARSDTFAHGFLVLPISAWLVWRGRDRLAVLQPAPSLPWLLPLLAAAFLWLLGELVTVNAAMHFALVAMLVLAVPLSLGWPATRALLFPLLFLFFGVPVGEFMTDLMMLWTADFTVAALRLTGVPVYREGLNFMIPSGNWSVVEACSGVRYLIASLMVGTLFAYLNYQSLTRRLVFVGVSILVPIVANWLRAYMIVMLGHLSDNRIATGVDHLVYGWVFFGVVIMIMFMIGARWSEPDRPRAAPLPGATLRPATAPMLAAAVVGGALAMLVPPSAAWIVQSGIPPQAVSLPDGIPAAAGWQRDMAAPPLEPRFVGASARMNVAYRHDDRPVALYLAYYRGQGPERKLVSSVNALVPLTDSPWSIVGRSTVQAPLGEQAAQWRATTLVHRGGGLANTRRQLRAWQLYWVNDQLTASDVRAKLHEAASKLSGRGDDGAAIVISTEFDDGADPDARIAAFVRAHGPSLLQALGQTRDAR